MKDHVFVAAVLGFFATLFFSAFFPEVKLLTLSPFLAVLFLHSRVIVSLWVSCFAGLFVDCFSSHFFGMYALIFVIVCALTYRQKRFFNEKPLNLAIYTAIISTFVTLIEPIFFFLFEKKPSISFAWLGTDVILMSIIDGLYAMLWFALPFLAYDPIKKYMQKILVKR